MVCFPCLSRCIPITGVATSTGDPRSPHCLKNAFDAGEDGLGRNANSLVLGCDCLGLIHYFDANLVRDNGELFVIKNAVRLSLITYLESMVVFENQMCVVIRFACMRKTAEWRGNTRIGALECPRCAGTAAWCCPSSVPSPTTSTPSTSTSIWTAASKWFVSLFSLLGIFICKVFFESIAFLVGTMFDWAYCSCQFWAGSEVDRRREYGSSVVWGARERRSQVWCESRRLFVWPGAPALLRCEDG